MQKLFVYTVLWYAICSILFNRYFYCYFLTVGGEALFRYSWFGVGDPPLSSCSHDYASLDALFSSRHLHLQRDDFFWKVSFTIRLLMNSRVFSSVSETDFEYIFLSHHEHWRRVWLRLSILRAMLLIIKSMILCFWHSSLSTVLFMYYTDAKQTILFNSL